MKISKIFVSGVMLALMSFSAVAQNHNEQVTVEGTYRPQIKRSERLTKTPETSKNDFSIPNYKAMSRDFNFGYELEIESMSALPYRPSDDYNGKGNFLKAAIGTRLSPVLVFRNYSELSRTMDVGVGVNHYSSWLDQKDYKKSTFMNNGANVTTVNRFKTGQLNAFADYHYDMYHLRSYDDVYGNAVVNKNGRNIHSVKAGAKWSALGTSYRQLYYEAGGDYRFSGIMGGTKEHQVNAKAHFAYSDNWFGSKTMDDAQSVIVDLSVNYDYVNKGLFMVALYPNFNIKGSIYNVKIGLGVDLKTDEKMGIYPDVNGNLFLIDKKLHLYADITGSSKINTFESILKENPFVTTNFQYLSDFDYEKTKIDLGFGGKLNVVNTVDLSIGARYRKIDNGLFYIPDLDFYAKYDKDDALYHLQSFDVIFQNYNVWNFTVDVDYKINDAANAGISLKFNSYSIEYPWYKPAFELKLDGGYRLDESWKFNASMYIMGKRWAMNEYFEAIQLKTACDIMLGADYNFTEDFAAFAEIHNLVHNKYQMYYNYPSMGFELFLGVKYRF